RALVEAAGHREVAAEPVGRGGRAVQAEAGHHQAHGGPGAVWGRPLFASTNVHRSPARVLRPLTRAGARHPPLGVGIFRDAENSSAPRRQFLRSGANQPVSAVYLARSVRISTMRTVCWGKTSYDPHNPRPARILRWVSPRLSAGGAPAPASGTAWGFSQRRV